MSAKRFTLKKYTSEDYAILDDGTEIAYASNKSAFTFCELLNELHEENQYLKSLKWNQDCINEVSIGIQQRQSLEEENEQLRTKNDAYIQDIEVFKEENTHLKLENEQLKSTIEDVVELLSEEVDLFSDKALEHDICAYIELMELDNKDAYYMATSTKKAIKMLKELKE